MITHGDYGLTVCLTGVFMGAWLLYTGHKIFGGCLTAFCALSFLFLYFFA